MFEFGEKRDVAEPKYHTDDFILKIIVPKVIVLDSNVTEKEAGKVAEKPMGFIRNYCCPLNPFMSGK